MKRLFGRLASARATQTVIAVAAGASRVLKQLFVWLFVTAIGRWQWQPPTWIAFSSDRGAACGSA